MTIICMHWTGIIPVFAMIRGSQNRKRAVQSDLAGAFPMNTAHISHPFTRMVIIIFLLLKILSGGICLIPGSRLYGYLVKNWESIFISMRIWWNLFYLSTNIREWMTIWRYLINKGESVIIKCNYRWRKTIRRFNEIIFYGVSF